MLIALPTPSQPWPLDVIDIANGLPRHLDAGDSLDALLALACLDRDAGRVQRRLALAMLDEAYAALDELAGAYHIREKQYEIAATTFEAAHDQLTHDVELPSTGQLRTPVRWDEVPLGVVADPVYARVFGVTREAVGAARRCRHTPAADRHEHDWDNEPRLGEMPDTELARQLRCSVSNVQQARARRDIHKFRPLWELVNWGGVPFGVKPDTELALMLDVPVRWVYGERRRRGITAFMPAIRLIDWHAKPLGMLPDAAFAREEGVSEATVARARRAQGKPRFRGDVLSQEGLPMDSKCEAMFDAVLHAHGIPHEHQALVGIGRLTADFRLGDAFVEVVGMVGVSYYDAQYKRKRLSYEEAGLKVAWLTHLDVIELYFDQEPAIPLRFRPRPECATCGRLTSRKGNCPRCHLKGRYGTAPCEYCGELMPRNSIAQRFHQHCAARGRSRRRRG